MVTRSLPFIFEGDDEKEKIRLTCNSEIKFDDEQWGVYGQKCIALIQKMLTKDAEKRPTIE
jgi:hypothetical protein